MNREAPSFTALSDPTRLRIVALLSVRGETCVRAKLGEHPTVRADLRRLSRAACDVRWREGAPGRSHGEESR